MRTKTILTAAALLAAGALTSMAQSNVFSLNVVGYVNVPLTNGFQMVANPLDLDGTGANNTLQTVFGTNLPNASKILTFSGGIFQPTVTYLAGTHTFTGGTNQANAALKVGGGVFVQVPGAATGIQPLTIVGNVLQGSSLSGPAYIPGFNIISSPVPEAGAIRTALGLSPVNADFVFQFNPATQLYLSKKIYLAGTQTWSGGGEPVVGIGESFWFDSHTNSSWTVNFTVH